MGKLLQPFLFDVGEVEERNKQIKQMQQEKENLEARKNLVLPHYEEPKNDNERLMNYQIEYITTNSALAWGKLIELSFVVTKRLIWLWMKKHKTKLDEIEQDEKTSIAVEYVLRRYKTRVGWCVTKNFITALNDGVKHAMLYTTEIEKNTVLIDDEKSLDRESNYGY